MLIQVVVIYISCRTELYVLKTVFGMTNVTQITNHLSTKLWKCLSCKDSVVKWKGYRYKKLATNFLKRWPVNSSWHNEVDRQTVQHSQFDYITITRKKLLIFNLIFEQRLVFVVCDQYCRRYCRTNKCNRCWILAQDWYSIF